MGRVTHYEPCPKCVSNGKDSKGDNLGVYEDSSAHCWACGYHVWPKHYVHKAASPITHDATVIPADFTDTVPSAAWEWLLSFDLPYSYWRSKVGWSPNHRRLLFPVGVPAFCTVGRYFSIGDSGASDQKRKWRAWGDCHKTCEAIATDSSDRTKVVLVEDLISAHKVAQVAIGIPLFGTVVHPCHIEYLNRNPDTTPYLWLDNDQELESRKKVMSLETVLNREVKVINTKLDPKGIPVNTINELLQ